MLYGCFDITFLTKKVSGVSGLEVSIDLFPLRNSSAPSQLTVFWANSNPAGIALRKGVIVGMKLDGTPYQTPRNEILTGEPWPPCIFPTKPRSLGRFCAKLWCIAKV